MTGKRELTKSVGGTEEEVYRMRHFPASRRVEIRLSNTSQGPENPRAIDCQGPVRLADALTRKVGFRTRSAARGPLDSYLRRPQRNIQIDSCC